MPMRQGLGSGYKSSLDSHFCFGGPTFFTFKGGFDKRCLAFRVKNCYLNCQSLIPISLLHKFQLSA